MEMSFKIWRNGENTFIQGFRLFDSAIDIVLTLEFGHNITILKMAYSYKVDCIEIEPALVSHTMNGTLYGIV